MTDLEPELERTPNHEARARVWRALFRLVTPLLDEAYPVPQGDKRAASGLPDVEDLFGRRDRKNGGGK